MEKWIKNKYFKYYLALISLGLICIIFWLIQSGDQTNSKNSVVVSEVSIIKEGFTFKYNQSSSNLEYFGTVIAPNGCTFLKDYVVETENELVTLNINLDYKGQVCTQQIRNIPISGNVKISLSQPQIENLTNTIQVKIRTLRQD